MKGKKKKRFLALAVTMLLFGVQTPTFAQEANTTNTTYISETWRTDTDKGYSNPGKIKEGDPHYHWNLGKFQLSGFTQKRETEDGKLVLIKNKGDQVRLSFELIQDINVLNGSDKLSICSDTKGSDEEFQIPKGDFGKGALIIQQTKANNEVLEPILYSDFLTAKKVGADTEVQLLEEGIYQVSLDYKLKNDRFSVFTYSMFPEYCDYKINFEFIVANGNTMFYGLDTKTGSELKNYGQTKNGFSIDLAGSSFLEVDVQREEYYQSGGKWLPDVKFHKPASDGEQFTEPGMYTIHVKNRYTETETEKIFFVGDDPGYFGSVIKEQSGKDSSAQNINIKVAQNKDNKTENNKNETGYSEKQEELISTESVQAERPSVQYESIHDESPDFEVQLSNVVAMFQTNQMYQIGGAAIAVLVLFFIVYKHRKNKKVHKKIRKLEDKVKELEDRIQKIEDNRVQNALNAQEKEKGDKQDENA